MFSKIKGFTRNGIEQQYVNRRFEYFHHYWSTIDPKRTEIFFDETRFESHRSLIVKIENQLQFNFNNSFKWFKLFFIDHSYFQKTNIIARKRSIQKHKEHISNLIKPPGSVSITSPETNYKSNKLQIISLFNKIKSLILNRERYEKQLANNLVGVLSKNTALNKRAKANIIFLVNAFITELYHYGYSLEYISKIPTIILSKDHMNEFPFAKTYADFPDDKKAFKEYQENERKSMTLEKILGGIINLINRPWREGYFVFKVNNLELQQPPLIEIGDVTFYNPQISSILNLTTADEENKRRYKNVDNFYYPKEGQEIDLKKLSTCNALIKSKFIASKNIQSSDQLFIAFHKVRQAVEILNNTTNKFYSIRKSKGVIHLNKYFQLHDDKTLAGYSSDIFYDEIKTINIKTDDGLSHFNVDLNFIKKLNLNSKLQAALFNIISTYHELDNKDEFFNFKDLWIAWESVLKRPEFISIAKTCFYIRYKKTYLTTIKLFLLDKLEGDDYFNTHDEYYTLNISEIKKTGLDAAPFKTVQTKIFKTNYKLLNTLLPITIINDIVIRIYEFIHDQTSFFGKLDNWIEKTINEVYLERNMEVHHSLKNDLSRIKLKDDMTLISRTVVGFLIEHLDHRSTLNNLNRTITRINRYKASI